MDYDPRRADSGGQSRASPQQEGDMATGRRERSCPICCEAPGDIAHALPCRHQFCLGCILRWLRGNRTCPLCRRVISTVSFSEQEKDCLQCVIRHPAQPAGRAAGSAPGSRDGSSTRGPEASPACPSQGPLSPAEPGAAGPPAVGGILPELWAELFRRRWSLLNPVRSWLQQWLRTIYRDRWWQVKTAESSILLALCIFGPDREVLVQRLQPRLRHYTGLLVHGVLGIIETQCSEEVRRLRRCRAQPQSPGARPGPAACPGRAPASGGHPGSSREDEAPQGSPSASGPVPQDRERP